jgi:ankyrin repeat protein
MNARVLKLVGLTAVWASVAAAVAVPSSTSPIADAAMRGDVATVRTLIARRADVNAAQGDGMTALHWAADRGDSVMASELLRAKASVGARTRIGAYTPLHIASRTGNPAVVRALLAAGSDVKATTTSGATALHLAAAAGNADAVRALLARGADPNARESSWGQTPLIFAAEYNRPAAIQALMKAHADPSVHTRLVNLSDDAAREQAAEKKRTAILISFEPPARHDSAEADFKKSLDAAKAAQRATRPAGADSAAAPAAGGRANQLPVREPRGPFTPEQIQAAIDSGRAVLTAATIPKDSVKEQVDTLNGGVEGFIKQVGSMGGLTALHHAVRQGNLDATLALLDGGANINDTSLVDGTTPLLMAIINGQFDVALRLVERGANPNLASASGMAPLYATINSQWAPRSRFPQPQSIQSQKTTHLELMTALLAKGADVNARLKKQPWYFAYNNCGNPNCGLENIDGTTPFWRASYALDLDAMKLLIAHGADPKIASTPPAPAARAARPAGAAADSGKVAKGESTPKSDSTTPIVASAAAVKAPAPNTPPSADRSRAEAASQPGLGSGAQVKLDPDIEVMAKAAPVGPGVLPIHAAAGVGYGNGFAGNSHRHAPGAWMAVMKYLVEDLHTDVNARDNNGYTALHGAAARGDNEMIEYLIAHGADVKAVSKNGRTVVDMANGPVQRLRPFPETIALLEKLGARNQHHCVSC